MKITGVRTFILRMPLGAERFFSSQAAFPERNSLLVRVDSDEGVSGWGEAGQYGPPEPVAACIERVLAPMLIGMDPLDRGVVWERLYGATRDFGQKGTYVEAISGLDIALWDIAGKAAGLPVHRLLGGAFRTTVTAYATGCYYRKDDHENLPAGLKRVAEEAASYVAAGFTLVKMKTGLLPLDADLDRVRAVRDAVGPETKVLIDSNHAYNVGTARRCCAELERIGGILWFEEPVPPEDYEGYAVLRQSTSIPIAGGECEFTRFGFRELFVRGCVDIAQPDVCAAGGISELMRIQALASAFGVQVIPHVWGSAVGLAAALQVLAVLPPAPHTYRPVPLENEPVVEFDRNPNALRDELAGRPFRLIDGRLSVPAGPGLGIEVDEEVLRRYSV